MNILFIDAYFYPEIIAFSHLEQDIIEGLVSRGHSVTVVCPTPSRGVTEETIKKYRSIKNETLNGVKIVRFWAPREGRNPAVRALRYFWCNLRGRTLGKRRRDTELVFAVSTPPTQGLVAGGVAKKLGVPFVYSVQDLFPDSLLSSGLVGKKGMLYKRGEKVVKKTYPRCDKIILLSDSFRESVISFGADKDRLTVIGNWIDAENVKPVSREDNRLFEELGIDREKFVVVYAGNFGESQGAQVVLEAAHRLKERDDIVFVIFGGGAEFPQAESYAAQNSLDNVIIRPLLPAERVSEVYSLGDAALITCKKGVGKTGLPSKLWSIMACDTPVIAAFDRDSELADILEKSGAGDLVAPEDPVQLAEAIEMRSREGFDRGGAREYVIEHAEKKRCVEKYVDAIENAR